MSNLSSKDLRTLTHDIDRIANENALFAPQSLEDLKSIDLKAASYLSREIRLSGNRRFLLTDSGYTALQAIVTRLDGANLSDGLADYSDLFTATKKVFEDCLSKGQRPEDGAELAKLIGQTLEQTIASHRFVARLYGVELKDIDSVRLGTFRIVQPTAEWIRDLGGDHSHENVALLLERTGHQLWLTGEVTGTLRIARAKFQAGAQLATGVLTVLAAALYQYGAHAFRIGIAMTPEESYGEASFLTWTDKNPSPSITFQYAKSQPLIVDPDMRTRLEHSPLCTRAFTILDSDNRNDLEDAIVHALYWYSDAHRDLLTEMRLLKYWSCVETFFSSKTKTTQAVTQGLAACLVFGEFRLPAAGEYTTFKRRLTKLYDQRSRATHEAEYGHVSDRDAADFSQWVSWMLLNMITLSEHGYTTVDSVKAWARAIDAEHPPPDEPVPGANPPAPISEQPSTPTPSAVPTLRVRLQRVWSALVEVFRPS